MFGNIDTLLSLNLGFWKESSTKVVLCKNVLIPDFDWEFFVRFFVRAWI